MPRPCLSGPCHHLATCSDSLHSKHFFFLECRTSGLHNIKGNDSTRLKFKWAKPSNHCNVKRTNLFVLALQLVPVLVVDQVVRIVDGAEGGAKGKGGGAKGKGEELKGRGRS